MGIFFVSGRFQAIDSLGNPLSGGKLYSYSSGTTTPKTTYSTKALTPGTENANPVVLDSRGEAKVYMSTGDYKFLLTDSADVSIWTIDEVESDLELSLITAKGDIIQGGTSGVPEKLAVGSEGQIPKVISGKLAYDTLESPIFLTNKSLATRVQGDVMVLDTTNNSAATTTTTQGDTHPVAVVSDVTIAVDASGQFYRIGIATIKVQGNVTRGNYLRASTTATRAEDAGAIDNVNGVFGIALTAYAGGGAGTVIALLFGKTTLVAGSGVAPVPIGGIIPYGGTSAPTGFLLCDGTSYLRADYVGLFAIIGVAFGSADGTHFNVPDLRQRFPIGKAAAGTGSTLGGTGGTIDHVHSGPSHVHTINHDHSEENLIGASTDPVATAPFVGDSGAAGTGNTGTGNPPFQAVNYLIKY